MIILNKKRLLTVASLLLVALFAFTFQKANVQNSLSTVNTVQTVTLPVSGKVIVLDAGHRETR